MRNLISRHDIDILTKNVQQNLRPIVFRGTEEGCFADHPSGADWFAEGNLSHLLHAVQANKKSLPTIARELNVDGIVEGTVHRSGDRVRITAQLIHGPSDKHLWANSYERDLRDVFALERDVTEDIARQVQALCLWATQPATYDWRHRVFGHPHA